MSTTSAFPEFDDGTDASMPGGKKPPPAAAGGAQQPPPTAPLTLSVSDDGDPLRIVNFTPALPAESSVASRNALVAAGKQSGLNLPEDGWRAIARTLAQPAPAAKLVKADLLPTETVDTCGMSALPGLLLRTHLFLLQQPRTSAGAAVVPPPLVRGEVDSAGNPVAVVVLEFDDHDHLRDHLKQVVRDTRSAGAKYEHSILTRRISREVITHVTRIEFADGSEPLWVIGVRDGITRVVSAWAATMEPAATADEIADLMAEELLAHREQRRGAKPLPANQLFAQGRDAVTARMRAEFASGMAGGTPSADAIRIGQTFAIPGRIYTDVRPGGHTPLPADEVFNDAVRAVVSSIHVEFTGWETTAENVEVGDRALHRVRHARQLPGDVVDLATGALGVGETANVFGDTTIPNTALWRAVHLVAALCGPPAFLAMKRELRDLLGQTRIEDNRYVSLLAPIIDRPWRKAKKRTLKQARNAWANGGPIPHELLGQSWTPTPAARFVDLVPLAQAGDREARWTLQVAGGIALVTDKLLTRNVGSQVAAAQVPFRADVDDVVSGLGESDAGLWLLARSADAFDADRSAINSFTQAELTTAPGLATTAYRVPAIDPDDPARVKADSSGVPLPLVEYDVVRTSDPLRSAEGEAAAAAAKKAGKGKPVTKSPAEKGADLRRKVKTGLGDVQADLAALVQIYDSGAATGSALGTFEEWQSLTMTVGAIHATVYGHQPTAQSFAGAAGDTSESDDDEGTDGHDDLGVDAGGDEPGSSS